jgi:Lon protease-like protein
MVAGGYRKVGDLPSAIPVFPLDGAVLLPFSELPLRIFEPRYLNMVDDAMSGDRMIGMIQTRRGGPASRPKLERVGCAGRITAYAETTDGKYLITLTGICRFETGGELIVQTPYRQVRPAWGMFQADLEMDDEPEEFERQPFLGLLRRYLDARGLGIEWDAIASAPAPALINSLAMALPFDTAEKQALLEAPGLTERRAALGALLEIDSAFDAGEDDEPKALQ